MLTISRTVLLSPLNLSALFCEWTAALMMIFFWPEDTSCFTTSFPTVPVAPVTKIILSSNHIQKLEYCGYSYFRIFDLLLPLVAVVGAHCSHRSCSLSKHSVINHSICSISDRQKNCKSKNSNNTYWLCYKWWRSTWFRFN